MKECLLRHGTVQSDTENIFSIAILTKEHPRLQQLINESTSQVLDKKTLPGLVYAARGPATARFLSDQGIWDKTNSSQKTGFHTC